MFKWNNFNSFRIGDTIRICHAYDSDYVGVITAIETREFTDPHFPEAPKKPALVVTVKCHTYKAGSQLYPATSKYVHGKEYPCETTMQISEYHEWPVLAE